MIEGNDEPARKKLYDPWTHVNQQMAQTETNIYNLLQSPDSNLDSTIKTQQEEVLRQQQVLVDQRASMDRRLAVAVGVSPAKKKAKGFYPDRVPETPPNIIPPPPPPEARHPPQWALPTVGSPRTMSLLSPQCASAWRNYPPRKRLPPYTPRSSNS